MHEFFEFGFVIDLCRFIILLMMLSIGSILMRRQLVHIKWRLALKMSLLFICESWCGHLRLRHLLWLRCHLRKGIRGLAKNRHWSIWVWLRPVVSGCWGLMCGQDHPAKNISAPLTWEWTEVISSGEIVAKEPVLLWNGIGPNYHMTVGGAIVLIVSSHFILIVKLSLFFIIMLFHSLYSNSLLLILLIQSVISLESGSLILRIFFLWGFHFRCRLNRCSLYVLRAGSAWCARSRIRCGDEAHCLCAWNVEVWWGDWLEDEILLRGAWVSCTHAQDLRCCISCRCDNCLRLSWNSLSMWPSWVNWCSSEIWVCHSKILHSTLRDRNQLARNGMSQSASPCNSSRCSLRGDRSSHLIIFSSSIPIYADCCVSNICFGYGFFRRWSTKTYRIL